MDNQQNENPSLVKAEDLDKLKDSILKMTVLEDKSIWEEPFRLYNEKHEKKLHMGYRGCYPRVYFFLAGKEMKACEHKTGA